MQLQTTALLIQAAALIFYAGVLTQTVREHDRRINKIEEKLDKEEA